MSHGPSRATDAADAADFTDADEALIAYLGRLCEMIAGRVREADDLDAIRAALVSVFESFTLRRFWTEDSPEWVDLDFPSARTRSSPPSARRPSTISTARLETPRLTTRCPAESRS